MEADILHVAWYAKRNDEIGGWCVMNVDKTPAKSDYRLGEWLIADFTSETTARHIAELHNRWLAKPD